MCGIFAIIPSPAANHEATRIAMLMLANENTARGKQSWGIWSRDGEVIKGFGGPIDGTDMGDFIKGLLAWTPAEGNWMAGHTRFATHGAITKANQHPFTKNGITLAHNGVVDVEGYDDKSHAVDSGRILESIVDHGYEKGIKNVTGTCGLLVSVQGELYAYRSNQTLHMARGKWGYMVSSAKEHIKAAATASGLEIEGEITLIEESHLMSPWGPREVHLHCPTSGTANRAPRTFYGSCGGSHDYSSGYDRDGVYYSHNDYRDYGVTSGRVSSGVNKGRTTTYKTCDVCGERMMFEDVFSEFRIDQQLFDMFVEARTKKIAKPYVYKTYDVCDQCAYKVRSLTIFEMLMPDRLSDAMLNHHIKRPLVAINQIRMHTISKGIRSSSNKKNPLDGHFPTLIRLELAVDEDLDVQSIIDMKSLYGGHNTIEPSVSKRNKGKGKAREDGAPTNVIRMVSGSTDNEPATEPNAESAAAVGKHIIITEQELAKASMSGVIQAGK